MLQLNNISITQFKNYHFSTLNTKEKVIGICGLNGVGKTNLLDAIYYLCFTKSYFTGADALTVNTGQDGFRLEGNFLKNDAAKNIVCKNKLGSRKEIYLNDILYPTLQEHIGAYPAVMIAPDDIFIIIGGSEGRRRFLDGLICQMDADYLQALITYNKVLLQRNSALKSFNEKRAPDLDLLSVFNKQMADPADYIHKIRNKVCRKLLVLAREMYCYLAEIDEGLDIAYESSLGEKSMAGILRENTQADLRALRTTDGIHKDDLQFMLKGENFKSIASQGQKKTLLFALKLAAYELLKTHNSFAPILLLDDVFEKLDAQRMDKLLLRVCKQNDGQVFITDTHRERLSQAFKELNVKYLIIEL